MNLSFRQMTQVDADAIRAWRYPDPYSFYDLDADPDDLAEFMNPDNWPDTYFSAFDQDDGLVGNVVFQTKSSVLANVGLGMRPGLTGRGLGTGFVAAALDFGAERFGIQEYCLEVAAFNVRAINVYRRLRFRVHEEFLQETNGGKHPFLRMRAPAVRKGACVIMADESERIALQLRDNKPHVGAANEWGLFGGLMEDGESPEQTILREIEEELEITLTPGRLRLVKRYTTPLRLRSHVFLYRLATEMTGAKLNEGQRFALVGQDDIQNGLFDDRRVIPYHHDLLEEYWTGAFNE